MDFSQMQTDALDLLQEIQNHPQYSLDKLKHYLNQGNLAFVRMTRAIETTVNITTVANQFEYDESDASGLADMFYAYQIRYVDGTETGRPLKQWVGGFTNLPKEYSYGTPYYYWTRNVHAATVTAPSNYTGVRIGTWPICSESSKTLQVDGYKRPATLVGTSDEPEVQPEWHDAIVYYAVYRFYDALSHLNAGWDRKADKFYLKFERLVDDANEFMSNQNDEPIEQVDVYDEMDKWY